MDAPQPPAGASQQYDNIINQTRNMTKTMDNQQRFQKARSHIIDALHNRQPRPLSYSPSLLPAYYPLYFIHTSMLWQWLVFVLSYVYLYLVVLDNQAYVLKIVLQSIIVLIFAADTFMDFYCIHYHQLPKDKSYPLFYYLKSVLIGTMAIDIIIFAVLPCYGVRPIRPFRLLRAFIPVVFDEELRKSLIALSSAWRDILVFIVFYTLIIVGVAFMGSRVIVYQRDQNFDQYTSNYSDFGRMIFQTYVLATYDNYPDNQLAAVHQHQPNYIFFIVFIFFNMFMFANIPGSLIYNQFRQTRSKYILVDQIKQQHSLILAFVTLAQDQNNLSMELLIRFLFYFYRQKIRYIQYITEICLRLDDNNNQTIQVNEFMQFSKIILCNSTMFPPSLPDLQCWISLRQWLNNKLYLKQIVTHWIFDLVTSIYIVLAFINIIFVLYGHGQLPKIFDAIFVWLFLVQLIIRILGIGIQQFFSQRWNNIDAFMIILNIVFFFVSTHNNIDNLIRMTRLFRIAGVLRILANTSLTSYYQILQTLKRIFSTFIQILPIIFRFFFLFAFVFYVFGVIGMEIFYETDQQPSPSPYNEFKQFSHFRSFLSSQYIMMQILTQGSWSVLAFDYSWRNPDFYTPIVLLFTMQHIMIVVILGTFLKGIFWEIYFTVSSMLDQIQQKKQQIQVHQQDSQMRARQITQINAQIDQHQSLEPDTILRRQIIQKKIDLQILKKIKNFQLQDEEIPHSDRSMRSINRSKIVYDILTNRNITAQQLQIPTRRKNSKPLSKTKRKKTIENPNLQQLQYQDLQEEMQEILNKLIVSSKIKYSQIIAYPRVFVQFLHSKFRHPHQYTSQDKFDMNMNPLHNDQSMSFHIYELGSMLGFEITTRHKKQMIVQCLSKNSLIDQNMQERIIKTQLLVKRFHIDTNGVLRKMYLSQANQDLVRKLQVQYFSDVYGNTFKLINKITLQPLLRVQATLTYTLWNILSYPQIDNQQFFQLITHIEDQMSNKLLKVGSLVKFVYKVDHQCDVWFSVQQKRGQDMHIRFIKTGLWAYTEALQRSHTLYARDVFNWDLQQCSSAQQITLCKQYIKLFYQSFQTLAFSLIDKQPFFNCKPSQHVYDLFLENYDVPLSNARNSLRISKIMLVILAKQEERIDFGERTLPYRLSDIRTTRRRVKKEDFILDDEDKETFQKLKNIAAMDKQKIIQSEGLPFSYILNLMRQIKDVVSLYTPNFVSQVQKALNNTYNSLPNSSNVSQKVSEKPASVQNILANFGSERELKPP